MITIKTKLQYVDVETICIPDVELCHKSVQQKVNALVKDLTNNHWHIDFLDIIALHPSCDNKNTGFNVKLSCKGYNTYIKITKLERNVYTEKV